MDFSKIKKIFYIVAIISMLLSIKSKVLGATNVSLDDFPTIPEVYDNQNFIIAKNNAGTNYYLFVLNDLIGVANSVRCDTTLPGLISFPSGSGKLYYTSVNNGNNWIYFADLVSSNNIDRYAVNISEILISSIDIYDPSDTNIIFSKNYSTIITPYFENLTEIEDGNPDGVIIDPGDLSNTDNLYFHLLEIQTGISTADNSIYYYLDKTFLLNKDSEYYSTMLADPSVFYYYIPRYKLGLSTNSSYLYVLNNSKNQIQNSHGLYAKDIENGIYDVIQSDTTGVITATEEESDRMKNIEESVSNNENTINNINNTINNTNITEDTETDIDTNLNYNNNNESLTLLNNGFFTRLTNLLSNISNYNLNEDTSISLPLPNSNKSLILHSIDLHNNINGTLRTIINAFWTFIFTFYLWKFINKIYISITTGNILDTFSSNGEAITNNML